MAHVAHIHVRFQTHDVNLTSCQTHTVTEGEKLGFTHTFISADAECLLLMDVAALLAAAGDNNVLTMTLMRMFFF